MKENNKIVCVYVNTHTHTMESAINKTYKEISNNLKMSEAFNLKSDFV